MPPRSLPFDVLPARAPSVFPSRDSFRNVVALHASTESVDGASSRPVAVQIRR
jgi:hypothetical protein